MKAKLIMVLFTVACYACSVEKQGSAKPDKESKVLEYLQKGYNEGDLSTVPFALNFHDLNPGPDYDVAFYQTMFQDRLFLPTDDKLPAVESGKTVTLSWKVELAKVDQFLDRMEKDPYLSLYKQECARGLITRTDLLTDTCEEATNALSRYVGILIDEQAYSPGLIVHCLNRLRKTWPAGKIESAAASTLGYQTEVVKSYDDKITLLEKSLTDDSNTEILVEFREIQRQNKLYFSKLSGIVN